MSGELSISEPSGWNGDTLAVEVQLFSERVPPTIRWLPIALSDTDRVMVSATGSVNSKNSEKPIPPPGVS